jgi:hypothetical protein
MGLVAVICGILSAKWSMELGASQLGQLLWGGAGLLLGPLALLILYVRQVRARQAGRAPGGQWISGRAAAPPVESEKRPPTPAAGHEVS